MDQKSVDVVCLVYNGQEYIQNLYNQIKNQKRVLINSIIFALTESSDESEKIIDSLDVIKIKIMKDDFSHSLSREKILFDECKSNTVVMLSQDVDMFSESSLYELTKNIISGKTHYAFGKQISYRNDIEKYIREYNYPNESYYVNLDNTTNLKLKDFFSSDAFAAYNRSVFVSLKGYDGKKMQVSEDMYYARKIILNHFTLEYCSEAVVRHSHHLNLKQLYARYVEIGRFFKQFPVFLDYKNNEAFRLLGFIIKRAVQELNLKVLFISLWPNLLTRYFGQRKGLKYNE